MSDEAPASASKRGKPKAQMRKQAQEDDDLINFKSDLLSRKPAAASPVAAPAAVVAAPALEPSTSQSSGDAAAAATPPASARKRRRQDATPNPSLACEPLYSHVFESFRNHPHAPEHIVWGSNSCFEAVRHFPALVLTDGAAELLSVESKAAIEREHAAACKRTNPSHPWVMQEPVRGGNVVVAFIYGPLGPSWNLADLSGNEWMPFDDAEAKAMLDTGQPTLKNKKKNAKDWKATAGKEAAWFKDSVAYAQEMHAKALERRRETTSLLAVDDSVAAVADPETVGSALPAASAAAKDDCREPGVLHAGDVIVIVRMKQEVPVRVLRVAEAAVELAGSYSLVNDEDIKHCGKWGNWQRLRRVPGVVELAGGGGAEQVFDNLAWHLQSKLVDLMAEASVAAAAPLEAEQAPLAAEQAPLAAEQPPHGDSAAAEYAHCV